MNKKRNRMQVIHDILQVIKDRSGRIKPTHILYKSNLSYQMMEEYLEELMTKDFIKEQKTKTGKTYIINEKGLKYLQEYSTINNFMDAFGLS